MQSSIPSPQRAWESAGEQPSRRLAYQASAQMSLEPTEPPAGLRSPSEPSGPLVSERELVASLALTYSPHV